MGHNIVSIGSKPLLYSTRAGGILVPFFHKARPLYVIFKQLVMLKFTNKHFSTLTKFNKYSFYSLFCLTISVAAFSQDGSNIRYLKTSELNNTHIGHKVQFDFYNRSFNGLKIDTISITVTGKSLKFVEHREDNGYNNWFSQQYLESLDSIGNFKLRVIYSKISTLTKDEIVVINYFNLYDKNNQPLFDAPFTSKTSYRRMSIIEVLVTYG